MTLALHGGTPVRSLPLPPRPPYGIAERNAANSVVASSHLSGFLAGPSDGYLGGDHVRRLEAAFCSKFGSRYAVAMNSATSCLFGAAQAVLHPGVEAIVAPWSMSASVSCVRAAGAAPVFADIEDETYGLDFSSVVRALTKATRAIVLVDLFGCPPRDRTLIEELAKDRGLILIEDAAQAIGAGLAFEGVVGPPPCPPASWQWITAGRGKVRIYSLNRHKTLQCGEGGVAVTDDEEIASFMRGYRNHGETLGEDFRRGYVGGNLRMGEIEAAIAEVQLDRLEELTIPRIANAKRISDALSGLEGLSPPRVPPGYRSAFYLYATRVAPEIPAERFAEALRAEGIPGVGRYVEPLYRLPAFRGFARIDDSGPVESFYPTVEDCWREVIVHPHVHAGMTSRDVDDVISAFDKVHDHRADL